ncbi:Uncharacterised protein [BD1-7 clade bacterium]|uniref:Uncharacterized protein n=1 Tax=BD1-7 clade bacterium TaxID=2029982 RepID=A0A5S9PKW0_9GAMM|nr:Uncharacterised protein [BD1-7 clade bacterium]
MPTRTLLIFIAASSLIGCGSGNDSNRIPPPNPTPNSALSSYESMRIESNGSIEGTWLLADSGSFRERRTFVGVDSLATATINGFRTVIVTLNDTGDSINVRRCRSESTFSQTGENHYTVPSDNTQNILRYTFLDEGSIQYLESESDTFTNDSGTSEYESELLIESEGFKISNATTIDDVNFNQAFTVNELTNSQGELVYQDAAFDVSCINHSQFHYTIDESYDSQGIIKRNYGEYTDDQIAIRAVSPAQESTTFIYTEEFTDKTSIIGDSEPEQEFILRQRSILAPDTSIGAQFDIIKRGNEALNDSRLGQQRFKALIQESDSTKTIDVNIDLVYE